MDFGEITEVVPWIEAAADLGQDLNAPQHGPWRAYKSHLSWDRVPQGCRYLCVLRDPLRALVSMYTFFDGWLMDGKAISLRDFAIEHYLQRKAYTGYWHHLVSWWQQRERDNVLLLCYENLQSDFARQLELIAAFLQIELDDPLREIVTTQSSLTYMQAHDSHFDDHFLREKRKAALGISAAGSSSKVSANTKEKPVPDADTIAAMQQRWDAEVTPMTGLQDYAHLLTSLTA